ncbi:MAG: glutamate ligase domain-containing protein, partial [Flavobacteriaceae bacterium]
IKSNTPVVIGEYHPETFAVFEAVARSLNTELFTAWNHSRAHELAAQIDFDLKGAYQKANRLTTLPALLKASELGLGITERHIISGMSKVIANTGLKGRWQWLNEYTVCDTAHNEAGLASVMEQLRSLRAKRLHLVIGVVADKDLSRVLPLFIKEACFYFVKLNVPRGLDAKILAEKASSFQLKGEVYDSVVDGLRAAQLAAEPGDIVFVGGSTFTVAEVV